MESDRLPRRLAAILYADIAGYSLDAASAVIEHGRGRADIQSDVVARNSTLPVERRIEFRIGVNLGDVIEDRGDVYGNGVNVAARLAALAEPGGVCVSESLRVAVGQRLPVDYQYIGAQSLKNIGEPVRAYRVLSGAAKMAARSLRPTRSRRPIAAATLAGLIALGGFVVMRLGRRGFRQHEWYGRAGKRRYGDAGPARRTAAPVTPVVCRGHCGRPATGLRKEASGGRIPFRRETFRYGL